MDGKTIVNSEILSPKFMPENPVHREKELAIVSCHARNAVNTLIFTQEVPAKGRRFLFVLAETVADFSTLETNF